MLLRMCEMDSADDDDVGGTSSSSSSSRLSRLMLIVGCEMSSPVRSVSSVDNMTQLIGRREGSSEATAREEAAYFPVGWGPTKPVQLPHEFQ